MSDEITLLKSAVTYGAETPTDAIDRLGDERTYAVMAAAMTQAVRRRFTGASLDDIRSFTEDLPSRFPAGEEEIKPVVAELVIRASLGSEELLEQLSSDDIIGMAFLLTYAIMSHENLDHEGQQEYFRQVIAEADSYVE